jgi:hypothetical protein
MAQMDSQSCRGVRGDSLLSASALSSGNFELLPALSGFHLVAPVLSGLR